MGNQVGPRGLPGEKERVKYFFQSAVRESLAGTIRDICWNCKLKCVFGVICWKLLTG